MRLALDILATDRVLTRGQLWRHHGLGLQDLAGVPHATLTLAPQHMRPALIHAAELYATTERLLHVRQASDLGHLIGTAEIRYRLQIPAAAWRVLDNSSAAHLPDAEFDDPDIGVVAVEYDTGTYTRNTIEDKLGAYRDTYSGIVWGALSRVRRERLQDRYPDVRVVDATWWQVNPHLGSTIMPPAATHN